MTTHYIDLRVVPDPETSAPQLLGALYDRLHRTLVAQRLDTIGVSFPGYSRNPLAIGCVLRLHADGGTLRHFMQTDWLEGLRDHVRMTDILSAPAVASHRVVHRRQFKTSAARLRRRRMRRKGETATEAGAAIPLSVERRPDLPFLRLHSRSTGQAFHLFIALGPPVPKPVPGKFDSYGLSRATTVPCF